MVAPLPARASPAARCPWLRLFKFQYHFSFISVVFGAALFTRGLPASLIQSLALLYISFNVLLYGGIYALNDLADIESDRRHPAKRNRPLPAGVIAPIHAFVFALLAIALGLVSGFVLFGRSALRTYLVFLGLNAFYSLYARNVPYLDIVLNASTHPLRFMLGAAVAGFVVPAGHLASYEAMAIGLSSLRRSIEMDLPGATARRTLGAFRESSLFALRCLALVAMVVLFDRHAPGFHLTVLAVYLTMAFVVPLHPASRGFLRRLWTR
jgi:decaprenyl-phosphate phosphoribosyltransferase